MAKFRVKEEIWYEVEAKNEKSAMKKITDSPDRDLYAFSVERYAVKIGPDGRPEEEDL